MQSPPDGQVTPDRIMQFAFGYAPPLILEAAISHGVFDALDGSSKTAEQVSAETGASLRGLRAVMNAIVGLDLLSKDSEGRYSLTPESAAFLVSSKPSFYGGLLSHVSGDLMPKWLNLNEVVRTGRPVDAVNQERHGAQFFQQFVESIFPLNYPAAEALAEMLSARHLKQNASILDLAAGSGVWGITLAQKFPEAQITAVDWVEVIPVTRRIANRLGVGDRFRYVEGDLQEADFGAGHDVATLGHILHSEGEERGRALLKKTFEALAPGGVIAIAEYLVNEDRSGPPHALIFAVNMLVSTDHGDTFSFAELSAWLQEIGFVNVCTADVPGPSPLILGTKPGQPA